MTNNPPLAPVDVPTGSYWYSKKEDKTRVFNVVRKCYNNEGKLTFDLAELYEGGFRILENILATNFIENAQNGKMIFIKNLSELSNQLKPNEPTNDTNSASSTTEN